MEQKSQESVESFPVLIELVGTEFAAHGLMWGKVGSGNFYLGPSVGT